MHRLRSHLSYANVVATLALVIAVAGGTTAIATKSTAPKNSVTSKSIRPYNVTARDLAGLILVKGEGTFTDPAPPDGAPSGGSATAACPSGTRLLSGGGRVEPGVGGRYTIRSSQPGGNGWSVTAEGDGTGTTTVVANAICLPRSPRQPQQGIP
jgi:hypothetical protein